MLFKKVSLTRIFSRRTLYRLEMNTLEGNLIDGDKDGW